MDQHTMKLADFLEHLKKLPADAELTFGKGNLQFKGIKKQGKKLFRIALDAPPPLEARSPASGETKPFGQETLPPYEL